MSNKNQSSAPKYSTEQLATDVMKPVNLSNGFKAWMGFLIAALVACLYAYYLQLTKGLGVTGLRDYVSWGMYISNFVFFVASSLIGMLITAVLGLLGMKWAVPLTRIAEIIALGFAMVAGLVIISDMGRPDRFMNLFLHGRLQSPILWDVTVVTTYVVISGLLLYLPLIPDLALCKNRLSQLPPFAVKIYDALSLNWVGSPAQVAIIQKSVRTLMILIIPVAMAIHTVTSWLFASTLRVGWDSTIFGPYFISGAFVAGCAVLIVVMFFISKSYDLEKYITEEHFDKMGKLLVLVSLVYLYFNINEYLVPAYKMKKADAHHFETLFFGAHAFMFWSVQIMGLILPIILLLFKPMRKPYPIMLIGISVAICSWFKRLLIVVPTMEHPFLPIQNVPQNFKVYSPTVVEMSVTMGSLLMVAIIVTLLSKFLPVLPIWEMTHTEDHE